MTPLRYQVPRIGNGPDVPAEVWTINRAADLECSAEQRPVHCLIGDPWDQLTLNMPEVANG